MNRFIDILSNINVILSFSIMLFMILIILIRKRITNKIVLIVLYIFPILICIVHFDLNNLHFANEDLFRYIGIMYLVSILFFISLFIKNNNVIYRLFCYITIFISAFGCFNVILSTSTRDSVHNLTYLSYTDSFLETLNILKEESVLNNHKKINYEYLKSK